MNVKTIGGMSQSCYVIGVVILYIEEGGSAKISMLMVCGKPLGLNLLLRIGAIKVLRLLLGQWD